MDLARSFRNLSQKGGLYLSNNLNQRWYEDADFTVPSVFPNDRAGEDYTVYCKFIIGNTGAGDSENRAENISYEKVSSAYLAFSGYFVSRRDDGGTAKSFFQKKVGEQWIDVDESYYTDKGGNTWPNIIWFRGVSDSGLYRLK